MAIIDGPLDSALVVRLTAAVVAVTTIIAMLTIIVMRGLPMAALSTTLIPVPSSIAPLIIAISFVSKACAILTVGGLVDGLVRHVTVFVITITRVGLCLLPAVAS